MEPDLEDFQEPHGITRDVSHTSPAVGARYELKLMRSDSNFLDFAVCAAKTRSNFWVPTKLRFP